MSAHSPSLSELSLVTSVGFTEGQVPGQASLLSLLLEEEMFSSEDQRVTAPDTRQFDVVCSLTLFLSIR